MMAALQAAMLNPLHEKQKRIKPRQAAALLFVGWYLMIPPTSGPNDFDSGASLNFWRALGLYNSADECEQAKEDFVRRTSQNREASDETRTDRNIPVVEHSQCISDQPPSNSETLNSNSRELGAD